MRYIIAYDIESDKKRTKISKVLVQNGVRIQYSVFECELTAAGFTALKKRLEEIPLAKNDSIIFLKQCGACLRGRQFLGTPYTLTEKSIISL